MQDILIHGFAPLKTVHVQLNFEVTKKKKGSEFLNFSS